jgi:hypothetical protein
MTSRPFPTILNAALLALALVAAGAARADDAADCHAAAGSYLTGVVQAPPTYVRGSRLHGVELSHTHIRLLGDADARRYDIAVDDVFASGYAPREHKIPAPLDQIRLGVRLSVCGIPFRGGMHWVHTNCGDKPTAKDPDGWLKVVAADGSLGPNLEGSTTYCSLWPRQ